MNDQKIRAFCDTETTGVDFLNDRLVEIGFIVCKGEGIVETYETKINPEMKIPYESTCIHNITDKDVENSPTFKDMYKEMLDVLLKNNVQSCIFHNADFDTTMISQEFARLSKKNNITDYIKSEYPDFIPERNRIYEYNKELNMYTYTGERIADSKKNDFNFIELFAIEDTMRLSFNFYDVGSLNALAAKLGIDSSERSEYHGALIDSDLLRKCYFKSKNELKIDLSDINRNLNGGNFDKLEIADDMRIDPNLASQLISINEEKKEEPSLKTSNKIKI